MMLLGRTMLGIALLSLAFSGWAMGLRSFVALPVDKGGAVVRLLTEHVDKANTDRLIPSLAYGLSGKQTLLLSLPYRLNPGGSNRAGDLSLLYRHTLHQDDRPEGTRRLGLLAGAVLPTDSQRDERLQLGAVATLYRDRSEWDFDFLWVDGLGHSGDSARYDVSWQYRLSPAEYPSWGFTREWDAVVELGGRWNEGSETVHQATLGLQSIHPRWVLEGGVVRDLNGPEDTRLILSTRIHF